MKIDPQVQLTAKKMIERYGEDACLQVEERVSELKHSEDDYADACKTWEQVKEAIKFLIDHNSNTKQ